jgi:capsular exopolysaccharide synthesis family protein
LRLKLAELRTRYTDEHPDVIQVQFEIAEVEKQGETRTATRQSELSPAHMRYLQLRADLAALEQRLAAYKRDARRLPAQIESYRRRIQGAPEHERLLAELRQDLETTQSKYDDLISKQQQAQTGERLERMNRGVLFRVVEPASLPTHPVAPNRLRIILAGAFAGIGLGLLLGFIAEQMDTAFENLEQLQGFTDLPVLAVIPPLWSGDTKLPQDRIAGLDDVSPIATEQYRTLATRLRYLRDASAVIAVTSTAGGEGKSVTAIQLASELAEVGSGKVLLVDGDLRKPSVQRYMNLPEGQGGDFVRLLMSPDDDVANYIYRIGRLNVLPTFHGHSKSTLLLGSPETGRLFAELRKRFDFIIVDSPPLLPLADGHILSRLVDDVILVVRARRTPRQVFRRAVESLGTGNIMGIVLNDVEYRASQYAYAYEYYTRNYSMRD